MISIVIPAHNEAAVIQRCLRALLDGSGDASALDVVVCCNGCSDDTAALARAVSPTVRVLELEVASKSAALNAGDEAARAFPRFYLDADIVLSAEALHRTAAVLNQPGVLAAAPTPVFDLAGRPWAVRAFYDVWQTNPYFRREGMIGSGVYALSAQGRERFERFPDITADDGFVRSRFVEGERVNVRDACFVVSTPMTLASLIKIKTRSRFGNQELHRYDPDAQASTGSHYGAFFKTLVARPMLWLKLPVYAYVVVTTARRSRASGRRRQRGWERDDSSRVVPGGEGAVQDSPAVTMSK